MKTPSLFAVIAALGTIRNRERTEAWPEVAASIDLVLIAFDLYPLVAVSEGAGHGELETREFFAALIRDRRFAPTVRNLVIEFGNARYQAVLDRYVTGAPVTRDELRHVWEDTTQISGVATLNAVGTNPRDPCNEFRAGRVASTHVAQCHHSSSRNTRSVVSPLWRATTDAS